MARPAKLSTVQCERARTLRTSKHTPVPRLAKQFKVSESSMYKVLDGTYKARSEGARRRCTSIQRMAANRSNQMPSMQPAPNLFPEVAPIGTQAGDDILLRAAQVIVARSRFASMGRTN